MRHNQCKSMYITPVLAQALTCLLAHCCNNNTHIWYDSRLFETAAAFFCSANLESYCPNSSYKRPKRLKVPLLLKGSNHTFTAVSGKLRKPSCLCTAVMNACIHVYLRPVRVDDSHGVVHAVRARERKDHAVPADAISPVCVYQSGEVCLLQEERGKHHSVPVRRRGGVGVVCRLPVCSYPELGIRPTAVARWLFTIYDCIYTCHLRHSGTRANRFVTAPGRGGENVE